MPQKIDYLLQDCEALGKAISNNRAAMEAKGFSEERLTEFNSAKEALIVKEAAYQRAVKTTGEKTTRQNVLMAELRELIKAIRNAAKSAYAPNSQEVKLFQIGTVIPSSVKKMRTTGEYLKKIIVEQGSVLVKNGITQVELDSLGALMDELVAVDADQENAKRLQIAAGLARDEAAGELRAVVKKVRSFAQVCFAKEAGILLEFKPLPQGRGTAKTTESEQEVTPAAPPTQ